jgi:hypothetical protein
VPHDIEGRGDAEKGKARAQAKADVTSHWLIVCPKLIKIVPDI